VRAPCTKVQPWRREQPLCSMQTAVAAGDCGSRHHLHTTEPKNVGVHRALTPLRPDGHGLATPMAIAGRHRATTGLTRGVEAQSSEPTRSSSNTKECPTEVGSDSRSSRLRGHRGTQTARGAPGSGGRAGSRRHQPGADGRSRRRPQQQPNEEKGRRSGSREPRDGVGAQ
jgi:hypothetical protein